MKTVRIGVIGVGNIGGLHTRYLLNQEISHAVLTCLCDIDPSKTEPYKQTHPELRIYENYKELMETGNVDAVIIAVPHYLHPEMAMYAFQCGLHVIVEKPVGVYAKNVAEMNAAARRSGKVFSSMFCVRTDPYFRAIRELVQNGELGGIKRVNWVATDWYRPQAYHDSSPWRSSWNGEGGGVLVNQSPHNLDILQWIFGLPQRVTAIAQFGKYYRIEVEDEVTAVLEYPTFTCTYIASTGEAPGTNRLEIAGDMGRLVLENRQLEFLRNEVSERVFNKENKETMQMPPHWTCSVPPKDGEMKHQHITQNFVNAILENEPLIAPGVDGIHEVELSNAIHMSAWTGKTVTLPVDPDEFLAMLDEKRKASEMGK